MKKISLVGVIVLLSHSTLSPLQKMAHKESEFDPVLRSVNELKIDAHPMQENNPGDGIGSVQITCFSEVVDDLTLHFQIIHLSRQVLENFSQIVLHMAPFITELFPHN